MKNVLKVGLYVLVNVFIFFVLNYNESLCIVSAHEKNNIILHQEKGVFYENDDYELNDIGIFCDYPPVIDDNTPSGNTPLKLNIIEQQR